MKNIREMIKNAMWMIIFLGSGIANENIKNFTENYQGFNAGKCDAFILKFEKEINVKENFQMQINFPCIYISYFFDKFVKIKFANFPCRSVKLILDDK